MLSIENFELVSRTPNMDEYKVWWVFKHKNNPTKVEIVFMNSKGIYSGNKYLIEIIKEFNEMNSYISSKAFKKKRNDLVNRVQTNNIKRV